MAKKAAKKTVKKTATKKVAPKAIKGTSVKKSTRKTEKKTAPKQEKQPYVQYSTISKSVGSKSFSPGEIKVCSVGKHKVVVQRHERLDRYGNPVHTAAVVKKGGSLAPSHTGNGSVSTTVSRALGKSGVKTKWNKARGGK